METTRGFKVGSWYRLYAISPNTVRRRQLLSSGETASAGGRRKLRATGEGAVVEDDRSLVAKLFEDPALPGRVPAQWYEPNATNPLGMDPWLLAAARYAAMAILTDTDVEPDRAPAVALDGTLDAYLYGGWLAGEGGKPGECDAPCCCLRFSRPPQTVPSLRLSPRLCLLPAGENIVSSGRNDGE